VGVAAAGFWFFETAAVVLELLLQAKSSAMNRSQMKSFDLHGNPPWRSSFADSIDQMFKAADVKKYSIPDDGGQHNSNARVPDHRSARL